MINFNLPYLSGKESKNLSRVYSSKHFSGNGQFTKKCHQFVKNKYDFKHVFLTNSCTSALELAALLLNLKQDDEVIIPSYTFITTANAFANRGVKVVFADSREDTPNIDEDKIEELITEKTKAIVVVHYAGVSCNMDAIIEIAHKYNLVVIEDAAQAIGSYYLNTKLEKRVLGSIGEIGCLSFHETKNIHCGEGGLFILNEETFLKNALYAWDKGSNRIDFNLGKIDAYSWVTLGSSFYPSDLTAAFLYAQLFDIDKVNTKRLKLWNLYFKILSGYNEYFKIPQLPPYAIHNAHLFYLITKSKEERNELIDFLYKNNIQAIFHYQSLHNSPYYLNSYKQIHLINSEKYSNCLLRLPLYYNLKQTQVNYICNKIKEFYKIL